MHHGAVVDSTQFGGYKIRQPQDVFAASCQRETDREFNFFASDDVATHPCELRSGDFVRELQSFGLGSFQIAVGPPILADVLDVGHVRTIIL
jgi:hypothetical protein